MFEEAKWITGSAPLDDDRTVPPYLFRGAYQIGKTVVGARLYASALGCYTVRVNGRRVSDRCFAPGYTQYDQRVLYNEYDVTALLTDMDKQGKIRIEAEVSGGWYAGRLGLCSDRNRYGEKRAFVLQLEIAYADGGSDRFVTDATWKVSADGPRRFADFLDGEVYDARKEAPATWAPVAIYTGELPKRIEAEDGVPVRGHERLCPISITKSSDGETLVDFGRNIAGIVEIGPFQGKAGQEIVIRHGELLQSGRLYTDNLRTAKAELRYICRDGVQSYRPEFTYMGFRYVSVKGFEPTKDNIRAFALYSDMPQAGSFRCSNEDLNQLQQNILTSLKANFVDIPTDCPQRDERCGWTGDIAVFAPSAAFNMDITRFMKKWLKDLALGQTDKGVIGMIAPNNGLSKKKTDNFLLNFSLRANDAVWGDAILLVPWAVYMSSGDDSVLRDCYDNMKAWVEYEKRMSARFSLGDRRYIWSFGFHFGDWLAPGDSIPASMKKAKWTSTAYFANSARLLSRIADILGKTEDAVYYRLLYSRIRTAFQNCLIGPDGHIKKGFQSIYVLALQFDLLTDRQRTLALDDLVADIRRRGNHLATGFVGTDKLLFALSDNGKTDLAYELLLQDSCPSWLYPIRCGATSIWERWDALKPDGTVHEEGNMVSFNHYAYGAVGNWLYTRLGGLEATAPGYREFRIAPMPGGDLSWAEVSHSCPYGEIQVKWETKGDVFTISFQVPAGTKAHVVLPDGSEGDYTEGAYQLSAKLSENREA